MLCALLTLQHSSLLCGVLSNNIWFIYIVTFIKPVISLAIKYFIAVVDKLRLGIFFFSEKGKQRWQAGAVTMQEPGSDTKKRI